MQSGTRPERHVREERDDTRGQMIAQERLEPSPPGTGGGGNLGALIPARYRRLAGDVKQGFTHLFPWL